MTACELVRTERQLAMVCTKRVKNLFNVAACAAPVSRSDLARGERPERCDWLIG